MVRKLILTEDDCAPDARECFYRDMFNKTGITTIMIEELGVASSEDDGYTQLTTVGKYQMELSADDPYFKLYELVEEEEIKPPVRVTEPERTCYNCFAAYVCRYNRHDFWFEFPVRDNTAYADLKHDIVRLQARACKHYEARK
jgi:hypothetical protein